MLEGDCAAVAETSRHADLLLSGSSAVQNQLLETSNETASQENATSRLRDKSEDFSQKTYTEIASACPGSYKEDFVLFRKNPTAKGPCQQTMEEYNQVPEDQVCEETQPERSLDRKCPLQASRQPEHSLQEKNPSGQTQVEYSRQEELKTGSRVNPVIQGHFTQVSEF